MRSKALCPKEVMVILSPSILLNYWQEANTVSGFTELLVSEGLAGFSSGFQLDGSCLGRVSVNTQELCIFAETFRTHRGFFSNIPFIQTGCPVFTVLCALTCPQRNHSKKSVLVFLFLFSSAELFGSTEILF